MNYDVIIIGNGLAATSLALTLPETYRVAMLCKHTQPDCASSYAQGGIAAVWDALDSVEQHVADTLVAGAGECNELVVKDIIGHSTEALMWLENCAVPFSRSADGSLHLTREGGHGLHRIAHVADHTGASIMQRMRAELAARENIAVYENHMALELLSDGNCCNGVRVLAEEAASDWFAPKVVIASGGMGQMYTHTTTPVECTGDGIALAYRAGCRVANLAFIQFHPTGLAIGEGSQTFLVSEAVRGEGGVLFNEAGERFMPHYDERAELAPRDIVARAIASEIRKQQQPYVWLDISHQPAEFIQAHFPTIWAHCLNLGIDITREAMPVCPVQHYTCGGVLADVAGHTDVDGLYCIGEAACTGLHGANRLASNSLLECVVSGHRAAKSIIEDAVWTTPVPLLSWVVMGDVQTTLAETKTNCAAAFSRAALKTLMSKELGIVRTDSGLKHARELLNLWQRHSVFGALAAEQEDQNLLQCAVLLAEHAQRQSRNAGAHFNADLVSA
ncbi:MAG: L-aspartate oxidase [Neisseria sp.]